MISTYIQRIFFQGKNKKAQIRQNWNNFFLNHQNFNYNFHYVAKNI
jgi:hypothetical protein